MPKLDRSHRDGYRAAAVREGSRGPEEWSGGPSTVHTVAATKAEVRMVQAMSRFRIGSNPSLEIAMHWGAPAILHRKGRRSYDPVHRAKTADAVANQCRASALNRHAQ